MIRPCADDLQQRWREGEDNGSQLWMEIKARGFVGEIDAVQRFIREWRKTSIGTSPCAISVRGLSPRQAVKLLLNPELVKDETEQRYLATLRQLSPDVSAVERLGIEFQHLVTDRRGDLFDEWLKQVRVSGVKEVENWTDGLLADEAAVRNALSLSWSNGQVEGQVNRLKTIKRQMYGRANSICCAPAYCTRLDTAAFDAVSFHRAKAYSLMTELPQVCDRTTCIAFNTDSKYARVFLESNEAPRGTLRSQSNYLSSGKLSVSFDEPH